MKYRIEITEQEQEVLRYTIRRERKRLKQEVEHYESMREEALNSLEGLTEEKRTEKLYFANVLRVTIEEKKEQREMLLNLYRELLLADEEGEEV